MNDNYEDDLFGEEEDVFEQGEVFEDEDDGFSIDMEYEEDTPNRDLVNEIKEPKNPEFVIKIVNFIVQSITAVIIFVIVFAIIIFGLTVLYFMSRNQTDVGGIGQAVDMFKQ